MKQETKNQFIVVFVLLALFFIFKSCSSKPDNSTSSTNRYDSYWTENVNIDINKTLVSNDIKGCGQYKYKTSKASASEFLVACTRDGSNWIYYLVFPNINKVNSHYDEK